jgi:hypothetical protein
MIAPTGLLLMLLGSVQAAPLLETRQGSSIRDDSFTTTVGVPATNRTIFAMISLICVGLLSFLLGKQIPSSLSRSWLTYATGSRFVRLKQSILIKRNFISILVLVIYTLVLIFIVTATVLVAAQGLKTYRLCLAGTWVCLILYTFTKGAILLFLIERIHVVRAPYVQRKNDKIYLGCLAMVLLMFGPVVVNCYIQPVTYMSAANGRCHFGIRGSASIPILAVNIFVDLVLTGVFFYLLRPDVRVPIIPTATASDAFRIWSNGGVVQTQDDSNETAAQRTIRTLLWKSIVGSLLIEIPMMANMIQFVITKGHELGTICTIVCVVEGKSPVPFPCLQY